MVIKYWDCTTQFPHCWNCYVITDIIINIIMIDSIIVFINITVIATITVIKDHVNKNQGPLAMSTGTGTEGGLRLSRPLVQVQKLLFLFLVQEYICWSSGIGAESPFLSLVHVHLESLYLSLV